MQYSKKKLTISLVTYNTQIQIFEELIKSLKLALENCAEWGLIINKLFILDNSPPNYKISNLKKILTVYWDFPYDIIKNNANLGFGNAHNIVLNKIITGEISEEDFHLIINPDIYLEPFSIKNAFIYLMENDGVGMVSPMVFGKNGEREYVCKGFPTVFDLFLRGFAPSELKRIFRERLERYEMRWETQGQINKDIPIASGCFMFLKNRAIKQTGLFDSDFFLYFEDFDYSIRLRKNWNISYHPQVMISHYGGYAAKKGIRHILYFIISGIKFFNKHGWRFI